MISYDQFIEKYPGELGEDFEVFEKDFPVGKRITWCDHKKYVICSYFIDNQFSKENVFDHMIVFKAWSKYAQRWCYHVESTFVFYSVWEMMKRELKEDKKKNGRN